MRRTIASAWAVLLVVGGAALSTTACSGKMRGPTPRAPALAPPPPPAASSAAPARQSPPPPTAAKESPFPAVARAQLANGLEVAVIEAHALPIVQIRVVVGAGNGYGAPAVADLTAKLLRDGGTRTMTSAELLRRVETLGGTLGIGVEHDGTVISLGVVKDHLDEALAILGEMLREPRFDEKELAKLKARQGDELLDALRSHGTWDAYWVASHEIYPPESPYSRLDPLPSEVAKVNGAAVRDFHRRFFVPKNVTLVVAGDVNEAQAKGAAEKAFGAWRGGDPPKVDFPAPKPLAARRVIVVDRPKSVQSDVFVFGLAPARQTPEWPRLRVALQVLGGGPQGRLFHDVREARSLAYSANTTIVELAHGDQLVASYAGTQMPKTAAALQGILENYDRVTSAPIANDEAVNARRFLSDVFAVRMETIGAIADMVVTQKKLGLVDPPGGSYWDAYRASLRKVDAAEASTAARALFHGDHALIVVAGDADAIAAPLSRFGDVTIVDPEHELRAKKTIPKNEAAPLDIEAPKEAK